MTAIPLLAARPRPSAMRAVSALFLREMASTYGRSAGGYIWAVLEPVGAVAILTLVFGLFLRAPALGADFPLFFATGYLPFALYTAISATLAQTIRASANLLNYPSATLADALIARLLLVLFTQGIVLFVVFSLIFWRADLRPSLDWGAMTTGLAMLAFLGVAVGLANCFLMTAYPVWERIWAILNRPMFFVSGVMFLPEMVPANYRDLIMLNPIVHGICLVRKGFFATYEAALVVPTYPFLLSLLIGLTGLGLLLVRQKDIRWR